MIIVVFRCILYAWILRRSSSAAIPAGGVEILPYVYAVKRYLLDQPYCLTSQQLIERRWYFGERNGALSFH